MSSRKGWRGPTRVVLMLVIATGACRGFELMSSPEATTTTFVEESGVLVYAPRSARAQKVVFDTPDKQLIHQRDTPMRKFFDEHAADFAPGKVDYAKTTILNDIIAMLRSKRYIGQMVSQVVERHRGTAIIAKPISNPFRSAESQLEELRGRISRLGAAEIDYDRLRGETGSLEGEIARQRNELKRKEDALAHGRGVADQLRREIGELRESIGKKDAESRKKVREAAALDQQITLSRAEIPAALDKLHAQVLSLLGSADAETRETHAPVLEARKTALRQQIATTVALDGRATELAQTAQYLAAMQGAAMDIAGAAAPPADAQTKRRRDLNAELLASTLTLALVRENYPDVRDDDIERVLNRFLEDPDDNAPDYARRYREVWNLTVRPDRHSPAVQELEQDLRSVLRHRDYLDGIVDEAVNRRRDLFKAPGSPAGAVRAATGELMKFVKTNLGAPLRREFVGSKNLWQAFLEWQNKAEPKATAKPTLRRPGTVDALTPAELRAFGTGLRTAVLKEMRTTTELDAAMRKAMASRLDHLRRTGQEDTEQGSADADRASWVDALKNTQSVVDAHGRLAPVAKKLHELTTAKGGADTASKGAADKYKSSLASAEGARAAANDRLEAAENGIGAARSLESHIAIPTSMPTVQDAMALSKAPPSPDHADVMNRAYAAQILFRSATNTQANAAIDGKVREARQSAIRLRTTLASLANLETNCSSLRAHAAPWKPAEPDGLDPVESAAKLGRPDAALTDWKGTTAGALKSQAGAFKTDLSEIAAAVQEQIGEATANGKTVANPDQLEGARRLAHQFGAGAGVDLFLDREVKRITEALDEVMGDGPKFRGLVEAARKQKVAETNATSATSALAAQATAYAAAEGTNETPGDESFFVNIKKAIEATNSLRPEAQRLDAAKLNEAVLKRLKLKLTPTRNGKVATLPDLNELLVEGFKVEIQADVSASLALLASRFAATFGKHAGLVGSDDPILTALLKSGAVRFPTPEQRATGTTRIPKAFAAAWGGKKAATATDKEIETALTTALSKPDVSYLFGTGRADVDIVAAFKAQLANAFRHKLDSALAAERPVDYEYWWLTFYPKAVPKGTRALEGESHIEVSFPESLVPEEQYRRWIQDRSLVSTPGAGGQTAGGGEWEHKLRLATDVLNDFLLVLDSSNLVDRHPGIREIIVTALDKFTAPPDGKDTGQSLAEWRYWQGVDYLAEVASDDRATIEVDYFKQATELRDLGEYLIENPLSTRSSDDDKSAESSHKSAESSHKSTESADKSTKSTDKVEIRMPAVDPWEDAPFKEYLETFAYTGASGLRAELREGAALDLAWDRFGAQHVLFAVTSASETRTSLPYKVALYASAFFDGSRRFTVRRTHEEDAYLDRFIPKFDRWLDETTYRRVSMAQEPASVSADARKERAAFEQTTEIAKLFRGTDEYVVPFEKSQRARSLRRYLLLKGVSAEGVVRLEGNFEKVVDEFGLTKEQWTLARLIDSYDTASRGDRELADPLLFYNVKFRDPRLRSKYLRHPPLWRWEMQLDAVREDLRFILVNLYSTSYPGVPDPERIKAEFRKDDRRIEALVYQLFRDLAVWAKEEGVLDGRIDELYGELYDLERGEVAGKFGMAETKLHELTLDRLQSSERADVERAIATGRRRFIVQLNLLLDRHEYLTDDSVAHLRDSLARTPSLGAWMDAITEHQPVMDQFSEHLLEKLYEPLFDACRRLNETQRHPVPFKDIAENHYADFRYWSKPSVQKGIQVIDLLPMSRDDLVAMSITEGGVIAEAAGQIEGAASYDASQMGIGAEAAQRAIQALARDSRSRQETDRGEPESEGENGETTDEQEAAKEAGIEKVLREKTRARDAKSVLSSSQLSQRQGSQATQVGAAAKGSLFGRAKAAMAFAKRREYLDAAITAAGRGDNFAKWVVRKSDVRSDVAGTDAKKNVAAAHTGYPNGDQPFHLLVKIPHSAMQTDWDGRRYIMFNSAYAATGRRSWYQEFGTLGVVAKLPLYPINPRSWEAVEEFPVGTVYPFKFDATSSDEQTELMTKPNVLGGRIYLDSTDKVKYSDVTTLIEAESEFVKLTRQAQSSRLGEVMAENAQQAKDFRKTVNEYMDAEREAVRDRMEKETEASGVNAVEADLQKRMDEIEAKMKAYEEEQKKAAEEKKKLEDEKKGETPPPPTPEEINSQ